MTYERYRAAEKPCPCGRGKVMIDVITKESDWSIDPVGWADEITCELCRERYVVVDHFRGVALIPRAEYARKIAARERATACAQAFFDRADVKSILDQVAEALEAQPTGVAKYRLAVELELETATLQTFRKHINGETMARWLSWHLPTYDEGVTRSLERLPKLYAFTNSDPEPLAACHDEIEATKSDGRFAPTIVMTMGPIDLFAAMARKSPPES